MKIHTRAFTAALLAAALGGVPAADVMAQAYKYKDEKGKTVFSDRPPPDGAAAEVVKLQKPAVTAPDNVDAKPADVDAKPDGVDAKPDDPALVGNEARNYIQESNDKLKAEQAKRKQDKIDAAERKKACDDARESLRQLTLGPPNRRLVQNADGTARRVSSDEMTALIDAARDQVKAACQSK